MKGQQDFPFEIRKPDGSCPEPWVVWQNGLGYAATEIGRSGVSTPLPGARLLLDDDIVLGRKDVLILSERSGGSRALLSWWCERLNAAGRPWILVHAREWVREFFDGEPAGAASKSRWRRVRAKASPRRRLELAIEAFGQTEGAVGRLQALAKVARNLDEPVTLIIRDLLKLNEGALEVATALRSMRDHRVSENLRIILVSHSEEALGDLYDQSGYLPLLWQFRVPSFSVDEVEGLISGPLIMNIERSAIEMIFDATGGQPMLVQSMLKKLSESPRSYKSPVEPIQAAHAVQAARLLRATPPDQARIWVEDLRQILKRYPDLVPVLREYVVGDSLGPSRFPPPVEERPLFVAGWLGLNRIGRWGIRSEFHAHLARPVLDELGGAK